MEKRRARCRKGATVVVVGAGGNIGSHAVPHLARMTGVGGVVLVDHGSYDEERDLLGQAASPGDIGKPKAEVQAERIRKINPHLEVTSVCDSVQNVPLGLLRGTVILSGLDSRAARQYVNEAAWRLGVCWVDAGVQAEGLLARVNVYRPGMAAPCLECAWDERDYADMEQRYPCGTEHDPPATNAPSSLGALAAAMQVIECRKLLNGTADPTGSGTQVLTDALHHRYYVMATRRNVECRFDHQVWRIRRLRRGPGLVSLRQAFDLARKTCGEGLSLRGPNALFATELTCIECGRTRAALRLRHRLTVGQVTCRKCGGVMVAGGAGLTDRLGEAGITRNGADRSLASLGLKPGDVFTVQGQGGAMHFELGAAARRAGHRGARR